MKLKVIKRCLSRNVFLLIFEYIISILILMEIITLSILLVGIVFVLMGYIELFYNEKQEETVVEYRFIPKTFMTISNQMI